MGNMLGNGHQLKVPWISPAENQVCCFLGIKGEEKGGGQVFGELFLVVSFFFCGGGERCFCLLILYW